MGFLKRIKNNIVKKNNKDEILEKVKNIRSDDSYSKGLKKTRESFSYKIQAIFTKHRKINEDFFDELEEVLIMADVGVSKTLEIISKLKEVSKIKNIQSEEEINDLIFQYLFEKINFDNNDLNIEKGKLNIFLVVGVNGVGKTTSIGKLVKKLLDDNYSVALAAADTFRAGAVEQLNIWAQRSNIDITKPSKPNQDPGSVVYEAIQLSKKNETDILIVDTAGRLHNKQNLMNELKKIYSIIEKENGEPAKETLLVIDATTGQNGVMQAKGFNEVANLTGIILTKMDSSSKGGIIIPIQENFKIPVKFIGLGESIDDFEKFDINEYLNSLTEGLKINEQEE